MAAVLTESLHHVVVSILNHHITLFIFASFCKILTGTVAWPSGPKPNLSASSTEWVLQNTIKKDD